jgi:hypothetical protein
MVLVCLSGSNWTLLKSLRRMRPGSDAIQAHWSTGLFGLGLALLSTRDSENNVNLFFCETHGEYTSTWVIYCDPWEYDGLFCNSSWIMIKLIRLKNIWRNTSRYGILSYLFMSWCVSMCLDASTVGWTAGHGTGPPSTWHLSWRDFNSVTSCTTVVLVHFMSIMSMKCHKVAGSHVCPPAIHIKSLKTKIALWRYCDAKDSKETATARHRRSDEPWWTREVSKKAEPMESRHMNVVWIVYVVFGFWISLLVSTRLSTTRWLGLVAIWTRLDNLHPWHPWAHGPMPIMPWETELSLECGRSPNVSKAPHALTSAYRLDSTPQCPTCRSMPQSGSNCSHGGSHGFCRFCDSFDSFSFCFCCILLHRCLFCSKHHLCFWAHTNQHWPALYPWPKRFSSKSQHWSLRQHMTLSTKYINMQTLSRKDDPLDEGTLLKNLNLNIDRRSQFQLNGLVEPSH